MKRFCVLFIMSSSVKQTHNLFSSKPTWSWAVFVTSRIDHMQLHSQTVTIPYRFTHKPFWWCTSSITDQLNHMPVSLQTTSVTNQFSHKIHSHTSSVTKYFDAEPVPSQTSSITCQFQHQPWCVCVSLGGWVASFIGDRTVALSAACARLHRYLPYIFACVQRLVGVT